MIKQQHAYTAIFQNVDETTTILTPNRRLAATLHQYYQVHQINHQQRCWPTIDILPLFSFMQRLWQNYTAETLADPSNPPPLLLNSEQEQLMWENILTHHYDGIQLLQLAKTIETTQSAWQLLHEWCIDLDDAHFEIAENYKVMQTLAKHLQTMLASNHWQSLACLPHLLMEQITAQTIIPPKKLWLVGFTELSPLLQRFIQTCEKNGSDVMMQRYDDDNHSDIIHRNSKRIALSDNQTEITTMARWAKAMHHAHPLARIACVIPDLTQKREQVLAVFTDVFADPYTISDCHSHHAFNISAGKYLAKYPIIYTALTLLGLYQHSVSRELFCYLLTSPYLGEAETEYVKRAHIDQRLRHYNFNKVNIRELLTDHSTPVSLTQSCAILAKRLQLFFKRLDQQPRQNSPQAWTTQFSELLTIIGWPGERTLQSEEYQVVETWLQLLTEFAHLDLITPEIDYSHALQMLHKMAAKKLFQAQTPTAPIQILGALEAAGLPFDFLWISGMDDVNWPPQPDPNPFIPKELQRTLAMPHATAERELLFCHGLIKQYEYCANEVIFSHAEKNEGLQLAPSTLLRDIEEMKLDNLPLASYIAVDEYIFSSKKIETLVDDMAPSINPHEKILGGLSILKQQALCPFSAFATWRLGAKPLEEPLYGLRKQDRGILVHRVLEKIWQQIKCQAALHALDNDALNALIEQCIQDTIADFPHAYKTFKQYISLEKKRLRQLIKKWLAFEKQRPPFSVIAQEKTVEITLPHLTLTTRVDRIDDIGNNEQLIIDYKTSQYYTIDHWFSKRPEEPQLPLYLIADKANKVGISFAKITANELKLTGISCYDIHVKGIQSIETIDKADKNTWDEQLTAWENAFKQLSDDFCQGDARVDPKEPGKTCEWCQLQPLCRINEEVH